MSAGAGRRLLGAAVLALALAGCAKKLPPPGGRPDVEPPRSLSVSPDSGAVAVPREASIHVGFSENMAHRDPALWLAIGPYVPLDKARWEKHEVTVALDDTLRANQTYTVVLGDAITDSRGNRLRPVRTWSFTTGAAFPPGEIRGRVDGRGHLGEGVYVWGYRDDLGHAADSTARDFDALAVGREAGRFALLGLPVPSRWKLYAFYDANRTQSFEPGLDLLNVLPRTISLTTAAPVADSVTLVSVDPEAQATVQGTVVDSSGSTVLDEKNRSDPKLKVWAEPLDTTRARGPTSLSVGAAAFRFAVAPGRYRVRAYLDANQNGRFDPGEPAGEAVEITAEAAGLIADLTLKAPPGVRSTR